MSYNFELLTLTSKQRDIRLDHHPHQVLERCLRLPAQHLMRPAWVANQQIDLGWSHEALVQNDMVPIVQPNMAERQLAEPPHRLSLPSCDDKIARLILLEHQPHRLDIIASEVPFALRLQVVEP